MVQQLQTGALDMGFLTVAEFSNRIDDMASLYATYLVSNVDDTAKLSKGKTATAMLDQYVELGMKGLGFGLCGMRHVISRGSANSAAGGRFQAPLARMTNAAVRRFITLTLHAWLRRDTESSRVRPAVVDPRQLPVRSAVVPALSS